MSRLIDADELLKQAYTSSDWDRGEHPMVVDVYDIENAPTIDQWHYPSKGEYPTESGDVLCCFYGLTSFKVGWYDKKDQSWCFDSRIIYPKNGADNIIAWQYIIPPKEEV